MTTPSRLQQAQAVEGRLAARLAAALAEQAEAAPHDVTERLRVARESAMAKARIARAAQLAARPVVATVVVAVGRPGAATLGASPRWWQRAATVLPLAMLVGGFVMVNRISEVEQVQAAAEIDTQLLADALPPAAYSDPGFAEFLRAPPP